MIAIDTNILVHSHRAESPWHERAVEALRSASAGAWAIPWPCVHEFLAIVTHPRIFDPPTPVEDALGTVRGWLGSPTLTLLCEAEGYFDLLAETVERAGIDGPRVHDARIAALCMQAGVRELLTADRDFSRFEKLRTRNPLAPSGP